MTRLLRSRGLSSVVDAVGKTPLVRLDRFGRTAPSVEIYLKLELANPGGSVKDRPALKMMLDAIADGRLTSDKILIDSTSGNTGVAYSLFGAALGHRVRLVMPSNVSKARKDIAADVVGAHGMGGAGRQQRDRGIDGVGVNAGEQRRTEGGGHQDQQNDRSDLGAPVAKGAAQHADARRFAAYCAGRGAGSRWKTHFSRIFGLRKV